MIQDSKAMTAEVRSAWLASATLHLAIPFVVALAFGWNRTVVGPETSLIISWTFWYGFIQMIWIGAAVGSELVYRLLAPWRPPLWLITVLGPVAIAVIMLGVYAPMVEFGRSLGGGGLMSATRVAPAFSLDFTMQFLRNILPGTVLWVGVNYLFDRMVGTPRYRYPDLPQAGRSHAAEPPSPPILHRLSDDLQGDLLFLQAEDHYVRVATTAGQKLVHSRFSDAITAAHPVGGAQVHRSFWVAYSAIIELKKTSSGAYSVLIADGTLLPVSRTYLDNLRKQHGRPT